MWLRLLKIQVLLTVCIIMPIKRWIDSLLYTHSETSVTENSP